MIELRTPYGSFDLSPNFRISIVDDNNVLDWSDSIRLQRTYPTTLPWTPNNAQIWMHADIAESNSDRLRIQCDLIVDGDLEFRGICNLLQSEEGKSYGINVTYDIAKLDPKEKLNTIQFNDLLSSFNPEFYTNVWTEDINTIATGNALTNRFALPVVRQDNYLSGYLNYWQTTPQTYDGQIVPMFYVKYVIDQIAEKWGLTHTGSFTTDNELLKLIIFNTYNMTANYMTIGPIVTMTTDLPVILNNHLPEISLSEFFNILRIKFACGMYVDSINNKLHLYTLRDILKTKRVVDVTDYVKGRGYMEVIPEQGGYTFEQTQDDEDTQTKYVKEDRPVKYKGVVAAITDLFAIVAPRKGDVYLVEESHYYWEYNGTTWILIQYRYHVLRNGTNKISDPSGAVICDKDWDIANGISWKVIRTQYDVDDLENNKLSVSPRFAIYQRLQNTPGGTTTYPLGSIDHLDVNGDTIGEMDLRDDGEYGLYNRYKVWRTVLQSTRRKPTIVLKNCYPILKKLVPDGVVQVNSQQYIWARKTRTYDIRGLVDVELECVKI